MFLTVFFKIFLFKIHAFLVFSTKTDALIKNFVKKKTRSKSNFNGLFLGG